MFTIALVNQKGGVGKSTTAVNLSAGLARLGKRVLLLDLDPQAHTTVAVGLQPKKLEKTIYTLLAGQARAKEVILPVSQRLSIIPASIDLAGGEAELAAQARPHFILKQAMAEVIGSDFDYAIVDSPPQLGFLNVNSLAWVKEVYIPLTCEFYALHGLSLLMETVERVQQKLNPDLKISGVIACQYQPRRALTRDVLADLERHLPGRVCKTRIRVNVRLAEAPSHGMNIFDYAPESNGATDYMNLAKEVLARCGDEPTAIPALAGAAVETVAVAADSVAEAPAPAPSVVEEPATVAPEPVVEAPPAEPVVEASVAAEPIVEAAVPEPVPAAAEPAPAPVEEPVAVAEAPADPGPATWGSPAEEVPAPVAAVDAVVTEALAAPAVDPYAEQPVEAQVTESRKEFVSPYPATPISELPEARLGRVDEPTPIPNGAAILPSAKNADIPFAQRLALAGLKPIVVAKPTGLTPLPEPPKKGLLGRLMPWRR